MTPHLNVLAEVAFEDEPINIGKSNEVADEIDVPLIGFVRRSDHFGDSQGQENSHDAKEDPTAKEKGWQNQGDQNAGDDDAGAKGSLLLWRDFVHLRIIHFSDPQIGDSAPGIL